MAAVILSIIAIAISAVAAYYTYQTVKVPKEMKEEQKRVTEESRRDFKMVTIKRVGFIILFGLLIYLSPFWDALYSLDLFKGLYTELVTKKPGIEAPCLITPITKSTQFVEGTKARKEATILIYINDQQVYRTVADKNGHFKQKISLKLKIGDQISVKQLEDREESLPSLPVIVSDDELKLANFKMEEDKTKVNVIDTTVTLLLSWAVLIIGGISYFVFTKYGEFKLTILVPVIFFFLVQSVYFGVSTKIAILAVLGRGNLVHLPPKLNDLWWNEIQSFEWGIVLLCIFFLWNLVKSRS